MARDLDSLQLRRATSADASGLGELWAEAFPGELSAMARERALLRGDAPLGGLECSWVAEEEGRFIGAFRLYELRMHLWGRELPVAGLASVAVAPEARRRGVGRWLCTRALSLARERGDALAALFPFRVDFYSRLGFTLAGELHRYRIPPARIPLYPGHDRVRRLSQGEASEQLPVLYRALLGRTQGMIHRTPALWRERLEDPALRAFAVPGRGAGVSGYLLARGRRASSPDRTVLRVEELLAEDLDSYRALLGWLSAQRDAWAFVRLDALPSERLHQVISHPRIPQLPSARGLWFPSATVLRGPMLRILDLRRILTMAGLSEGGFLQVRDDLFPDQSGSWVGGSHGIRHHPGDGAEPLALTIGAVTDHFVRGELPGQAATHAEWNPLLGIHDFRLLDIF